MKPKVLILQGYGINCDNETKQGFELAGGEPERVHLNQLIGGEKKLKNYQILALPGGFSFGDDIGAGKVLAIKIKANLSDELLEFIGKGKLIIGICNGFQAMVKLGVLPGIDQNYERPRRKAFGFLRGRQDVSLTFNDSGRFEDRWVYLKVNPVKFAGRLFNGVNKKPPCVWTKGIERLYLPIRHGEGKFVTKDKKTLEKLEKQNQIVLQYTNDKGEFAGHPWNPNGSELDIAGICDETGRILGLMPHPEAFLFPQNHPRWTREMVKDGQGLRVFQNAVNFVKKEL